MAKFSTKFSRLMVSGEDKAQQLLGRRRRTEQGTGVVRKGTRYTRCCIVACNVTHSLFRFHLCNCGTVVLKLESVELSKRLEH